MSAKTLRLEEYLWSANRKVARGIEGIYKKNQNQNTKQNKRETRVSTGSGHAELCGRDLNPGLSFWFRGEAMRP